MISILSKFCFSVYTGTLTIMSCTIHPEVKCGDDQTEEQANEDQNSDDKGQKVLVQCNEKQKYDH